MATTIQDKSTGESPEIAFQPARESDFEQLVALKVAVQRDHLERLGRFTPDRARDRFRAGFSPQETRLVHVDGAFAGCVTVHIRADHCEIEHLYIAEAFQGRGLGTRIMRLLMDEARSRGQEMRATVLNLSPANGFYQRLGFTETSRDAIDINYAWRP